MESLRQEIRNEMKSIRINKAHVYDVLLRLVDELDSAKTVASAPAPAPEPVQEEPVQEESVKKIVRRVRKKVESVA